MWSEAVKEIPDRLAVRDIRYLNVRKFLEDVINNHMNKLEQIFWEGDYASVTSAYHSIRNTIKDQGYPIILHVRGEELYLERRDI